LSPWEILQLRWRIYADARKWEACLDIATALTTMTPERRFGWIHRAHALDKLGRTLEAKDLLLSVANDFEINLTMSYHLAQYCARLRPPLPARLVIAPAAPILLM
jgi:predicted Zn-dependent protease